MVKVLFVCMGNICRSPTAHGVFRSIVENEGLHEHIVTDSAGTHAYHVGSEPDGRSQSTALRRGIDISDLRARKVCVEDFINFDYVIPMDRDNLAILEQIKPSDARAEVNLFLSYGAQAGHEEVPDPYYGGAGGFELVFDLVEEASRGLLEMIRTRHDL